MKLASLFSLGALALFAVIGNPVYAQTANGGATTSVNWPLTATELAVTGVVAILAGAYILQISLRR